MNTIGFNTNCSNAEEENILQKGEQNASCGKAINNVVTVRFDNGVELPYYNNKFNLNEGDRVFVDGKLTVLIIKDGIGTAFFEGKTGHVVDFKYNNSGLTEMFCDCIKPNFYKHFAAICIFLNDLTKENIIKPGDDFFAVSGKWFYEMMQNREISL